MFNNIKDRIRQSLAATGTLPGADIDLTADGATLTDAQIEAVQIFRRPDVLADYEIGERTFEPEVEAALNALLAEQERGR